MRQVKLNGQLLTILEPGDPGYTENAPETKRQKGAIELRVSEKRAVSLYGLRRFPITLYADEWDVVLANADRIREFLSSHTDLARK